MHEKGSYELTTDREHTHCTRGMAVEPTYIGSVLSKAAPKLQKGMDNGLREQ